MSLKKKALTVHLQDVLSSGEMKLDDDKLGILVEFLLADSPFVIFRNNGQIGLTDKFVVSMVDSGLMLSEFGENEKIYDFVENTNFFPIIKDIDSEDLPELSSFYRIPLSRLTHDVCYDDTTDEYKSHCKEELEQYKEYIDFLRPEYVEKEVDYAEHIIKGFLKNANQE